MNILFSAVVVVVLSLNWSRYKTRSTFKWLHHL